MKQPLVKNQESVSAVRKFIIRFHKTLPVNIRELQDSQFLGFLSPVSNNTNLHRIAFLVQIHMWLHITKIESTELQTKQAAIYIA